MTKQTNKGKIQLNLSLNELITLTKAIEFYEKTLQSFGYVLYRETNSDAIESAEALRLRLLNKRTEYNKKQLKEVSDE